MKTKRIAAFLPEELLEELDAALPRLRKEWGERRLCRSDVIHRGLLQILRGDTSGATVGDTSSATRCDTSGDTTSDTSGDTSAGFSVGIDRLIDRSIDQGNAQKTGTPPALPSGKPNPNESAIPGEVLLLRERFRDYEALDDVLRLMVRGSKRDWPTLPKQKRLLTEWAKWADREGLDHVFRAFDALLHAPEGHVRHPEPFLNKCLRGSNGVSRQRSLFEEPRPPPGPGTDLVAGLAEAKRLPEPKR